MKNENGIEKSAILKGQTLVNLFNKSQDSYTIEPTKDIVFKSDLYKTSTTYLIKFDVVSSNTNNKLMLQYYLNGQWLVNYELNIKLGINKFVITSISNQFNTIKLYYNPSYGSETVELKDIMLIEYQQGMEDWDIPYFEGMQSVKMPVLKATGKNLFDIDSVSIKGNVVIKNSTITITSNGTWQNQAITTISVNCGETYVLSFNNGVDNSNTGSIKIYDGESVEEILIAQSTSGESGGKVLKFTPNTNKIKVVIEQYGSNGIFIMSDIQIEKGSDATSYEPYKSNILTVNEEVELRGIGDVKDELNLLTGELTQRIGEVVLDGSSDKEWGRNGSLSDGNYLTSFFTISVSGSKRIIGSVTKKCDKLLVHPDYSHNNDVEGIHQVIDNQISIRVLKTKLSEDSANGFKQWLQSNPITVQYQLVTESTKPVNLSIKDQNNQPQDRMKIYPSGYINTSSSTFPPILELKGITHNNKLNMTTTNGVYTNNIQSLTNPILDGIICKDGTVVRDSYDVESGLYTKRVFRFTIDEEFIETYKNNFVLNSDKATTYSMRIGIVTNCGFPKIYQANKYCTSNIAMEGTDRNSVSVGYDNFYIQILKEELSSYDINGILEWVKRNGAIEMAYAMDIPQIIHMQPNMTPYVSTRPYQGSIESQGNILESSYLDYTSEQSIISPKPLGDGDVLRWEQGSQCYVYENEKDYIPLTDYNQPIGTVLDLEEEDGEQFVENLDGGDIIVDVPFKEKAVYERHLVSHEDSVIYPTQDKLDPTGKIEVDYICGETWQNPNDLSDIRHVGTLREDGQYDVTIRRSGDDEIRLMDGTTHLSLDGDGLNPSEFELTFFNSGGVEVGKYGDTRV